MTALYAFTYTPGDEADDEPVDMVGALLDAYLTPSSLARVLGVSRGAIYGWRMQGTTPHADTMARIEQLYAHLTAWDVDA